MDIQFMNSPNPDEAVVTGEITIQDLEMNEKEEAIFKTFLEIFAKCIALWVLQGRPHEKLNTMLNRFFQDLTDNKEPIYLKTRGFMQRITVCDGCGYEAKYAMRELPRYCPGCGAPVKGIH